MLLTSMDLKDKLLGCVECLRKSHTDQLQLHNKHSEPDSPAGVKGNHDSGSGACETDPHIELEVPQGSMSGSVCNNIIPPLFKWTVKESHHLKLGETDSCVICFVKDE